MDSTNGTMYSIPLSSNREHLFAGKRTNFPINFHSQLSCTNLVHFFLLIMVVKTWKKNNVDILMDCVERKKSKRTPVHIERSFFLSFGKNNSIDVKNMPKWRHLRWKMSTIFPAAGGERKKKEIQLFFFYLLSNIDMIFIFFPFMLSFFFLVCFINFYKYDI